MTSSLVRIYKVVIFKVFLVQRNRSAYQKYARHKEALVDTSLEEFKDEGFTLKTHQMFSVHTTPENFHFW